MYKIVAVKSDLKKLKEKADAHRLKYDVAGFVGVVENFIDRDLQEMVEALEEIFDDRNNKSLHEEKRIEYLTKIKTNLNKLDTKVTTADRIEIYAETRKLVFKYVSLDISAIGRARVNLRRIIGVGEEI